MSKNTIMTNSYDNFRESTEIIRNAICDFSPVKVILMFSGGHDSLVSTHICASILSMSSVPFEIYHGDTTIGIPQTQEYVKDVCSLYNWKLNIRKPPNKERGYDWIVKKFGFPGPTKASHQMCYRWLKERALSNFVTHECKTTPYSRQNVMLCTGVRKDESRIRMGYINTVNKEHSKVWVNPIFNWTEQDICDYLEINDLPKNPVKEKLCISGECLCGCFARKEEFAELKESYPETAHRIEQLHKKAKENGHPWPWGFGPREWYKRNPKNQISMFMCVGCESKKVV